MRARFRKKESRSFFLSICAQLAFNVKGPWEAVQSYHHDGSPAGCGSSAPGGRKKAGTAGAKAARQTPAGTSEKAAQAGLRKIMSRAGKIKKNPIGEF